MKKVNLLPADIYKVINKAYLTLDDRDNLISLYEPIIGPMAVSLYLTLWHDLDYKKNYSKECNHHHLMTIMKTNLDTILLARNSLEAIGLLKTFYQSGDVNNYIYELYAPMSPKEFLNHPILNVVLYNNIGKTEYDAIKNNYQSINIDTSKYEDISSTLNETFTSSNIIPEFDVRDKIKLSVKALNVIDFELLISSLPKNTLSEKALNKRTKELIENLAFVYDLDTLKFMQIIKNSVNEKGLLDATLLRKNARTFYTYQNNGKLPTLIYRKQPEYLKTPSGDSSKKARIISVFENTTPYDFITSKYHGAKPAVSDLKLIETLMCDLELKPAVVNVLIDYVLKKNNNKLNKNFVETIAGQWKRNNIETAEEAMKIAEKEHKKLLKQAPNDIKNPEAIPVWFNVDIKSNEASESEKKELEELMKGLE